MKENTFRLGVPETVVSVAAVRQAGEEWVVCSLLPEILNGGERHVELGVGQLFPAGDAGKVRGGFYNGVQATHVGNHDGGVQLSLGGQTDGLLEIVGVAAGGTQNVGRGVVAVVEIDGGGEVLVRRAGEEIHTPVVAQQPVSHFH